MKLTLDDGAEFVGTSFGAERSVAGEVVFTTAMGGYVEALTDPSFAGQILVMTHPQVGNYGVPDTDNYESPRVQVQGLVVAWHCPRPSHHSSRQTLGAWLVESEVPGVSGIDTRALTRRLRERGTMRGVLSAAEAPDVHEVEMRAGVFRRVAPTEVTRVGDGDLVIGLVDVGAKESIVRELTRRGVAVLRIPWHADVASVARSVDGVVIGNGPGDPADLTMLHGQLRELLTMERRPILGICLGSQLLAIAAGAATTRLKYGHRGCNQPVQDLVTRRSFITSQNHGYAVLEDSLQPGWEPWFVNLNDGTNEGIRATGRPFWGVQFHPEAAPGPRDTGFIFDDFVRAVHAARV